jgi:hypothetical protein
LGEEKDKNIYGIIRVYSKEGVVLGQIEKEDKECRLLQPNISASNKREKTLSVNLPNPSSQFAKAIPRSFPYGSKTCSVPSVEEMT